MEDKYEARFRRLFDEAFNWYAKSGYEWAIIDDDAIGINGTNAKVIANMLVKFHLHINDINEKQNTISIKQHKEYTPPFRVGRKLGRVILDGNGLEFTKFPEGHEDMAQEYCDYLNNRKSSEH